MRITELLDKRSISLTAAPASKSEALDMAVDLMAASGKIRDKEAYRKEVYLREEESTTGVGGGIAIPHGKCDAVAKPGLAAMVIKDGVDFDSLDGEPVNLIFLIAAPNTKDNIHLDVLSKLSILLMDEQFSENLKKASTPEEFLQIIDEADEEKPDVDEQLAAQTESKQQEKACIYGCGRNRKSSEKGRMLCKGRDKRIRRSKERTDRRGNCRGRLYHRCGGCRGTNGPFPWKASD